VDCCALRWGCVQYTVDLNTNYTKYGKEGLAKRVWALVEHSGMPSKVEEKNMRVQL